MFEAASPLQVFEGFPYFGEGGILIADRDPGKALAAKGAQAPEVLADPF